MAELTKTQIINASKEIAKRAIPYLIIVPIAIIFHLIVLSIWAYYFRDLHDLIYYLVIIFGILLPIMAYVSWGIKRFVAGAYLGIHNNIIEPQLHPFCKKTADLILHNTFNNSSIPNHIVLITSWRAKVDNSINSLPSILQFVIRRVTRKLSLATSVVDKLQLIGNKDPDGIANLLNKELALALITTSNNVVPPWLRFSIPVTLGYYFFIWFI